MPFDVFCPACKRKYKVPDGYVGEVQCTPCNQKFRVGDKPEPKPQGPNRKLQLLAAALQIMKADGELKPEETAFLETVASLYGVKKEEIPESLQIFDQLIAAPIQERHDNFQMLLDAAAVDGKLDERERKLLVNFSAKLKIDLNIVMKKIADAAVPQVRPAQATASSPVVASAPSSDGLVKRSSSRPAKEVEIEDAPRRPRIKRVFPNTPAARLGLAAGDHVLTLNAQPVPSAREWYARLFKSIDTDPIRVQFFCSQDRTVRYVESTPIMFGVELEETLESLEDACAQDPNNFEFALEYMRKLYIAKDFSKCAEVAEAWNRRYRETPALMFLGAAMIGQAAMTGGEKGGELAQKGYEFVLEYMKTAMNKWTTEFAAIALVSRGICHEGFQDKEKAEKAYREALELDPECAPALESMADLTGKPAESFRVDPGAKWVGQPFPLEYQLPWHPKLKDGAPAQNFRAALQPGGYLGIILLGSYRGCGPCNVETRNVALLAKQFRDKITAVHLITANEERERENWNDAERWFRSSGLNFHVLFDAEDKVAQAVGLTGAPTLVFVDAQGTIVSFSNELKEDLYWRLAQ